MMQTCSDCALWLEQGVWLNDFHGKRRYGLCKHWHKAYRMKVPQLHGCPHRTDPEIFAYSCARRNEWESICRHFKPKDQ